MTRADNNRLRLGFARGVAPSKWARRWAETGAPALELVPLPLSGRIAPELDIALERVTPGSRPVGTDGPAPQRSAVQLYTEAIALVVAKHHELSDQVAVDAAALALLPLLDHPDHAAAWPPPVAWDDPAWMPRDASAALELVASGLGAILLPLPLARHLVSKREHAVLPLHPVDAVPGTAIWASWARTRDDAELQRLVGVLRGRTARSGRSAAAIADQPAQAARQPTPRRAPATPKKTLPKNSRGAQLAAAKARRRGKR